MEQVVRISPSAASTTFQRQGSGLIQPFAPEIERRLTRLSAIPATHSREHLPLPNNPSQKAPDDPPTVPEGADPPVLLSVLGGVNFDVDVDLGVGGNCGDMESVGRVVASDVFLSLDVVRWQKDGVDCVGGDGGRADGDGCPVEVGCLDRRSELTK